MTSVFHTQDGIVFECHIARTNDLEMDLEQNQNIIQNFIYKDVPEEYDQTVIE